MFARIPRTRIAGLSQPQPPALRIAVGCDCHADAFELRRGRVVIDIKDGPPPRQGGFETRLDSAGNAPPPRPARAPAARPPDADAVAAGTAPTPDAVPPLPALLPVVVPGLPGAPLPPANLDLPGSERARQFEELMLEQIARAGAQGIIEPVDPVAAPAAPDPAPQAEAPAAPSAAVDTEPANPPADPADHVLIETAVDRDRNAGPQPLAEDGGACIDDRRLDLAGWGYLAAGKPDIASYRAGLSGEFDDIVPERAATLARYYLFLTFGAEAAEQLRLVPGDDPDRPLLAALAEIMDGTAPDPQNAAFDGQAGCPTASALWAVLSSPGLRGDGAVDETAVLQGFTALPEHVKRHLGPRLVDLLRDAGRTEAAEIVRHGMTLAARAPDLGVAVAGARLDSALGDSDKAAADIRSVLDEVDPDSPEALLALAEARIAGGGSVEGELLSALEAVGYNLRGTELGRRIDRAVAESHLSRGEFAAARDLALGTVGATDDAAAADLLRRIYARAATDADPEGFLRLVLPAAAGLGVGARETAARHALAERLLALGLPDDALAVLGQVAGDDDDGRWITGRAQLAAGRPDHAIAALSAIDPARALPLLGAAHERAGRHELARLLYERAGMPDDAARMSLRLGDWQDLAARGETPLHDAASRLADTPAPVQPDAGPRRIAGELLARSQAERAAFEQLLAVP